MCGSRSVPALCREPRFADLDPRDLTRVVAVDQLPWRLFALSKLLGYEKRTCRRSRRMSAVER
jgi:hypothetical protein